MHFSLSQFISTMKCNILIQLWSTSAVLFYPGEFFKLFMTQRFLHSAFSITCINPCIWLTFFIFSILHYSSIMPFHCITQFINCSSFVLDFNQGLCSAFAIENGNTNTRFKYHCLTIGVNWSGKTFCYRKLKLQKTIIFWTCVPFILNAGTKQNFLKFIIIKSSDFKLKLRISNDKKQTQLFSQCKLKHWKQFFSTWFLSLKLTVIVKVENGPFFWMSELPAIFCQPLWWTRTLVNNLVIGQRKMNSYPFSKDIKAKFLPAHLIFTLFPLHHFDMPNLRRYFCFCLFESYDLIPNLAW